MAKKKNTTVKRNIKKQNPLGYGFFVVPLIIIVFLYAFIIVIMEDKEYHYISPVFKNYQALEKTEDKKLDNYFTDEIGVFYDEERHYLINESSNYFYDKTGVRLYAKTIQSYIDENTKVEDVFEENGEQLCKEIYDSFSDNGVDMVVLFVQCRGGFVTYTYATDEVKSVYGDKLERILEQYMVYYYNVVGEFDELFYYSYRSTADRIMGGFTSPLDLIKENLRVVILFVVAVSVIGASIIFYRKMGKK